MVERNEMEKGDEFMMPGFRFHPTDEELVGFYLKRKVQQRPLAIELIRQLDIYKYDPWDLPRMATTGEKEWYFYCPRDRKYKNSARPNRVTGAGFWKATGTDRPIYSSEESKCIGLKKSLVFYRGRAAKGIKTDWMMHEFRLPSLAIAVVDASQPPPKRASSDKHFHINDTWAICKIFKKTNSMAHRALSHPWIQEPSGEDFFSNVPKAANGFQLSPSIGSCSMAAGLSSQFALKQDNFISFPLDILESASYKYSSTNTIDYTPPPLPISAPSFIFSPEATQSASKCGTDAIDFGHQQQQQQCSEISVGFGMKNAAGPGNGGFAGDGSNSSISFPFSLLPNLDWKATFPWDSPPRSCEISPNLSSNQCFT